MSELLISMEDHEQRHNMAEMNEDIQINSEDMMERATSPTKRNLIVEDITDNHHCEQATKENVEDATKKVGSSNPPKENVEITTTGVSESSCFPAAQTDDGSINVPDANLPVQHHDIVPEQQNKEHPKTSMINRKKTKASKMDLKKKHHSLAGGGSSWTTGIRRSSRIRSKPLEYWKGERLLYARVHNSVWMKRKHKGAKMKQTKLLGASGWICNIIMIKSWKNTLSRRARGLRGYLRVTPGPYIRRKITFGPSLVVFKKIFYPNS